MTVAPFIKFLDPYEKPDQDIYFGREDEIEQLYTKVKKTSLFVLYGLSGTGKTSILRCGLSNKFDEADWQEIFIRRGSDRTIMEAILADIKKTDPTIVETDTEPSKLIAILRHINRTTYKHIYLIFDQFEELFINGGQNEKENFIRFLMQLAEVVDKFVTVVLVLREEYLANLNDFKISIRTIFNDSIRLERMSSAKLEFVVFRILTKAGFAFDKEIIDKIIQNVISPNTNVIDLPYVQVYLKKLFDNIYLSYAAGDEHIRITADLLPSPASIDDLLGSFLDTEIDKIVEDPANVYDRENVWKMLKILVTPEGTKRSLTLESIAKEYQ